MWPKLTAHGMTSIAGTSPYAEQPSALVAMRCPVLLPLCIRSVRSECELQYRSAAPLRVFYCEPLQII